MFKRREGHVSGYSNPMLELRSKRKADSPWYLGMLERLPKKRLGRSPSFPVSRSYESVFWIIIHQMVMRWFLLYVFDASLCSLLSFPPFFSVLWILLYWLYFKLLLSLQGPLLTFCYHYCVSSFTDNSKIQINRNFTINEKLP